MGKKLIATQKSYNEAFKKHMHAYISLKDECYYSRCMLLCYSVECGLKCLIMKNNRIYYTTQANEKLSKVLGTHDVKILLRELRQAGNYLLENTVTMKNETVNSENYHQVYRYCIPIREDKLQKMKSYEETLVDIVSWLREEI